MERHSGYESYRHTACLSDFRETHDRTSVWTHYQHRLPVVLCRPLRSRRVFGEQSGGCVAYKVTGSRMEFVSTQLPLVSSVLHSIKSYWTRRNVGVNFCCARQ